MRQSSVIGNIASETVAEKLLLSHFMARSLNNLQDNLDEIRSRYSGPVITKQDLECVIFLNSKY